MRHNATLVKVLDGAAARLNVDLDFNLRGVFDVQFTQPFDKRDEAEAKRKLTEDLRSGAISVDPTGERTGAGRWWATCFVITADGVVKSVP